MENRQDTHHVMNGRTLTMGCRDCDGKADVSDKVCMRCIISALGGRRAERVVMRTWKDVVYAGDAVSLMNDIAYLDAMAGAMMSSKGNTICGGCDCSPANIVGMAWAAFPDIRVRDAMDVLDSHEATEPECRDCILATCNMLEHIDSAVIAIGVRYGTG